VARTQTALESYKGYGRNPPFLEPFGHVPWHCRPTGAGRHRFDATAINGSTCRNIANTSNTEARRFGLRGAYLPGHDLERDAGAHQHGFGHAHITPRVRADAPELRERLGGFDQSMEVAIEGPAQIGA
jgi:hypothetical protein